MVRLTRIHTRTGDGGRNRLADMSVTDKTDLRVAAYGDVDETNSTIGMALAVGDLPGDVAAVLRTIQNELFDVGAALLHLARTVARRAERSTWAAAERYGTDPVPDLERPGGINPLAITYLNRLSDLLFILTRTVNGPDGDVLWTPGGSRKGAER